MTALCGLFLWNNIMATDVDVQYFSHLNGLVLGNNWGDLIRLLDKTLVTGIAFTEITAASIDDQGDVHITLYSAHNALLFQVVELTGFTPNSFNQKYRIKGTPSATELILKPSTAIAEKNVITKGIGKLVSLGYEIIFRDTGDVKRVYRAKNPHAEHPFIRVDETITDGTNSYTSTYAKSAMVGLLENMTHIDDYENPNVVQLPIDTSNLKKNWKITGTGSSVVRGWCKWVWSGSENGVYETTAPQNGARDFTLIGGVDAFFLANAHTLIASSKNIYGCGIFNSNVKSNVAPQWFLSSVVKLTRADIGFTAFDKYGNPFIYNINSSKFLITAKTLNTSSMDANAIMPNYDSGKSNIFSGSAMPALEIPFYDNLSQLRGTLPFICYIGKPISATASSKVEIHGSSMYVIDACRYAGADNTSNAGVAFYLGELE